MSATRKFAVTAVCFAIAAAMVALASVTKVVGPLFAAWGPLLAVPYVLTRPEPGVDDLPSQVQGSSEPEEPDPQPEGDQANPPGSEPGVQGC